MFPCGGFPSASSGRHSTMGTMARQCMCIRLIWLGFVDVTTSVAVDYCLYVIVRCCIPSVMSAFDRRVERGAAAVDTVKSTGRCRAVGGSMFVAQCRDASFDLFSFLCVVLLVCCCC